MSEPINRMQLLRGDLHGSRKQIRPPWSQPEALFIAACVRCDECLKSCQEQIIQCGAGGFPCIDFSSGACTFCGDCVRACRYAALSFSSDPNKPPWLISVEIKEDCLAMNGIVCRSCGERCDESAIGFQLQTGGRLKPSVNPELCSGCGECFSVCPSHSINIRPRAAEKAA